MALSISAGISSAVAFITGALVFTVSILIDKRRHKIESVKIKACNTPPRESTDSTHAHSLSDTPPQAASNQEGSPLAGEELLRRVKSLGDISKYEIVRACGYVSIKADGSERLNVTAFYEALLEAKGVSLTGTSESDGESKESFEVGTLSKEQSSSIDWTGIDWTGLSNDRIVAKIQSYADVDVDTLETLLGINYWRVREAIALHPGTSDVVLRRLLEDADADVRSAVSRRDLPSPWCSMGKDVLLQSLRTESAPSSVLERLAKSEDGFTRVAVASNPGVSVAILESLQDDSSREVRSVVGERLLTQKLPEEWKLLDDDQRNERLNEGVVPIEVLEILAISLNWKIRQAVARHEGTPDARLNQLAEDGNSDVRQAIKDRPLPLEWQKLDEYERVEKLSEPIVPSEVLQLLSQSSSWRVRRAVARSRSVSEEILDRLKDDDDSDVASAAREGLLSLKLPQEWRLLDADQRVERVNEGIVPVEVLELLAISSNWYIRQAVARHEGTPDALLNLLAEDDDGYVREAIEDRRLPLEWRLLDEDERIEKLSEPVVPSEVLQVLSQSSNWMVRQAVALNRSVNEEILDRLKDDDDTDVASAAREGLLSLKLPQEWKLLDDDQRIERLNDGIVPVEVLELLAISSNWQIRQAVARHEGTPDALLNQLAEDDDSDVRKAIEDRQLPLEWRQLDENERIEKLSEPVVPSEVLQVLSQSGRWSVRQAVARNRSVNEEILDRLKDDEDSDVASAAREGLLSLKLPQEWKLLSELQKVKRLSTEVAETKVLEVLALSRSPRIREAVARNSNVSIKIVLGMKEDSATGTRIERLIRTTWGASLQDPQTKK